MIVTIDKAIVLHIENYLDEIPSYKISAYSQHLKNPAATYVHHWKIKFKKCEQNSCYMEPVKIIQAKNKSDWKDENVRQFIVVAFGFLMHYTIMWFSKL